MRGAGGMSPFDELPSLVLDRYADRADDGIVGAIGEPIEHQRRGLVERAHATGPAHASLSPSP